MAEVFFIKRPCDAQALIAKERGALEGQGRQCFLSCGLDLENMVSLALRRQVGSCEATLGRVFSSGSGRRHLLLVAAFSVRVIVGDHLVAVATRCRSREPSRVLSPHTASLPWYCAGSCQWPPGG